MSLCFVKCSQCRTSVIHVYSSKNLWFSLVILILLNKGCPFNMLYMLYIFIMIRWLSIWTPKNLTKSVTFNWCPCIVIDVSLMAFLCEKLIRCVFPGFNFIVLLSPQVRIWFRYFCDLRLILQIPGACAQIAMLPANSERLTCTSVGWRMSLTYKINRIGERVLPWLHRGWEWLGH